MHITNQTNAKKITANTVHNGRDEWHVSLCLDYGTVLYMSRQEAQTVIKVLTRALEDHAEETAAAAEAVAV